MLTSCDLVRSCDHLLMSVIYVCSQGAISASVIDVANVCMYVHC